MSDENKAVAVGFFLASIIWFVIVAFIVSDRREERIRVVELGAAHWKVSSDGSTVFEYKNFKAEKSVE